MTVETYKTLSRQISGEVTEVLSNVDPDEVHRLIDVIM